MTNDEVWTVFVFTWVGGFISKETRRLQQISYLELVFSVFSVFPFWPILTGLTGSGLVVFVDYNSFYKTFAGLFFSGFFGLQPPPTYCRCQESY